ncbi:MAG: hypothetical protein HON90_10765 [Halobacteriovoraceae bacterium]|jgi:hypothetical protein|nr:hypothetical protein [Halobacteriovoraceae bacterium]
MKTRVKSFIRAIFIATLASTVFVSCGETNKSGGSNDPAPAPGTINTAGTGQILPANWRDLIFQQYPCKVYTNNYNTPYGAPSAPTNNVRRRTTLTAAGQIHINAGALHVGVTTEGDVLIMSNNNNTVNLELHSCERPGLQVQASAQFMAQPVINDSKYCAMGEVTAADISLGATTQYGQNFQLHFAFYPVGLSAPSTLCNQNPMNY